MLNIRQLYLHKDENGKARYRLIVDGIVFGDELTWLEMIKAMKGLEENVELLDKDQTGHLSE